MTGKSIDTAQAFNEAHQEVACVRTLFHEWLCTVYSTSFRRLCYHSLTIISHFTGEEEKQKRSPQGTVSVISMTAPYLADANCLTTPDMDTTPDVGRSTTVDMDTTSDVSRLTTADSDTTSGVPTSNCPDLVNPSSTFFLTGPEPLMSPGIVATGHPPTSTGPGGASGIPPPPNDLDSNPPPNSFPPTHPNTPTPGTTFTQPLLTSGGNGAFNMISDCGDFISEGICAHWESVPGGEKWVEMVKSYLTLEAMPSVKGVSVAACRILQ